MVIGGISEKRPTTFNSFGKESRDDKHREEQFKAMREDSQNLLDVMSISQQKTQECTEPLEDSPSLCLMRLVLHPEVDRAVTAFQKKYLGEEKKLYRIEMQMFTSRVKLGREEYIIIFEKDDPMKLSITCRIIGTALDPQTYCCAVFITDKNSHVRGRQEDPSGKHKAMISESQGKSQQGANFQKYTLGVVFSAPLVGRDVHGKYHPCQIGC
ncbi:hypothetical protein PsorP6_005552 [Peronosclerospora sorghi]|uniref:Uncharacterized protein n=1 Tax=Peronosclerospora sorghi TaxID=230839 RepID=A0ACC0W671_9STRA|nr:hypothetical protein PsorP6_005552 [Peronosclerospora sorghi]